MVKKKCKTLTIYETVTITEYAPALFDAIRELDGITPQNVCLSLSIELNKKQVFKAKESAGKSGSFFFFSYDRKFLIKTMNDSELEVFKNALPMYLKYLYKNPLSLLARIYGIFTVNMEDIVPVHILLMSNAAQAGKHIDYVFDLKGSMINRVVKGEELTPGCTLKDLNILDMKKDNIFLTFQHRDITTIVNQVFDDLRVMSKENLMDYSFLLIVETNPEWIQAKKIEFGLHKKLNHLNKSAEEERMMTDEQYKIHIE